MKRILLAGAAAVAVIGAYAGAVSAEDGPANTLGMGGYWDTIA
jgi:hypothetical protein